MDKQEVLQNVVIKFAGDSGDGMQLTGSQFTNNTALLGIDLATFPDFPAEIRAPQGTTFGVPASTRTRALNSRTEPSSRRARTSNVLRGFSAAMKLSRQHGVFLMP